MLIKAIFMNVYKFVKLRNSWIKLRERLDKISQQFYIFRCILIKVRQTLRCLRKCLQGVCSDVFNNGVNKSSTFKVACTYMMGLISEYSTSRNGYHHAVETRYSIKILYILPAHYSLLFAVCHIRERTIPNPQMKLNCKHTSVTCASVNLISTRWHIRGVFQK